ncbi:MAG TPA: hypothetical protein VKZ98_00645 [Aquaticitalea sp.]|nr:hypothetical protein [Aquaticitalea sp.]
MKKKWINFIAVFLTILTIMAIAFSPNKTVDMTKFSTAGLELNYTVHKDIAMLSEFTQEDRKSAPEFSPFLGKAYLGFKEAVAFKESRGNYRVVNDFGYLGKYQFGVETLKALGVFSPNDFLNTPELQEKAFMAYAQRNKWILRKDIARFEGKKIRGIVITESGILAAAHLGGAGSVKKFLRSYGNETFSDAFGTSMRSYLKKFSGYDTSAIIADRKAKVII